MKEITTLWRRRRREILFLALRRLVFLFPLPMVVTIGVFALAAISPFDPLDAYMEGRAGELTTQQQQQIIRELQLDAPFYAAWWEWAKDLSQGELGTSRTFQQPVVDVLQDRLPWTLLLGGVGLAVSVTLSLLLGLWAGLHPRGSLDRMISGTAIVLQGTPPFVLALTVLGVFAIALNWLPTGGLTDPGEPVTADAVLVHLLLPAAVLAITQLPWLVLSMRESVADVMASDAVRGARVRGIPLNMIARRHVLPAALPPFVALVGARLPELIAGSVLVESIFAWPGLGNALVRSAQSLDFSLLTFLTVSTTALVLLGNLLADVAFVLLDPRVDADA